MAGQIPNTRILGATLFYHIGLALILAVFLALNHSTITWELLSNIFNAWDAKNYLYLAKSGYQTTGEEAFYIAFFPFYPFLIRLLSFVIPFPKIAALLVSIASSIIGHVVFIKFLNEIGFPAAKTWRIALLLFLTPITIYFSILYTEGLYLAESALFLYFLEKRKYEWSAFFGFCAGLTRIFGFLFIIPYFCHFIETNSWRLHLGKMIQGIVLISIGLPTYLLINFIVFTDPFHFRIVQKQNWYKESVNPLKQYIEYGRWLLQPERYQNFDWNSITQFIDQVFTILAPIILLIYLLIIIFNRYAIHKNKLFMSSGLILWAIAQLLVISSQSFWLSNARYVCLILPLYIALEEVLWLVPVLYYLAIAFFGFLAFFGVYLFSKNAWLY